ncbi:uncharacterized RING finger protein ZK945.4-like isoform X2 [Homarus americanus]|uniref:uncharacterized RING finger protein ZK945.4-like isoform X2 n=1 Tax=Homarus americanus TaxID=6706 RepID=UPI001C44517F|nr:uncharacterized RING finger protein ZK945.4-like isoform X2 [Homarus americanus]
MADKKDDPRDCKVCFMKFDSEARRPRVLVSCGHSFCSVCITNLIKDNSTLLCPSCRAEQGLTCAEQLPVNFGLLELVDSDKDSSSDSLVADRTSSTNFESTGKVPVLNAGHCEEHGQYKLFRCTTCAQYICHVCTVVEHPNSTCTVISVKKALEDLKELHKGVISSELSDLEEVTDHLETYDAYLATWIGDHEDHICQLSAELQLHNDIIQELQEEREKIKVVLDDGQHKKECLKASQDHLEASNTVQDVSDAVDETLHCQTVTKYWNLQCTEQFPKKALISSSLKMHAVTAFALDMMKNYDNENTEEDKDEDRNIDNNTDDDKAISEQVSSLSIKEKLIEVMQEKGLSESNSGNNTPPPLTINGAEGGAPEVRVGGSVGEVPHPPLSRAPPFPNPNSYCPSGRPDLHTQWINYYRSLGMHREADSLEQQARSLMRGGGGPGTFMHQPPFYGNY